MTKQQLDYNLFIIDYNNGHMKEVQWFRVDKSTFNDDWTLICNTIPKDYLSGLGSFEIQEYMQDHNIRFNIYPVTWTVEKALEYINANDHNKKYCKLVEHHNIGNY